jgi:hypothetical protein
MSVKQFIDQMKAVIESVRSEGTKEITCESLIKYLNDVGESASSQPDDTNATTVELEQYKAKVQLQAAAYRHDHEANLEMFRSVIQTGQGAIKSSFLLNGGASLAILAFIGHLAKVDSAKVSEFADCILPFSFGVLFIAIVSGGTYLTQCMYSSSKSWVNKTGVVLQIATVLLTIVSYGMYVWGLMRTYQSFAVFG